MKASTRDHIRALQHRAATLNARAAEACHTAEANPSKRMDAMRALKKADRFMNRAARTIEILAEDG